MLYKSRQERLRNALINRKLKEGKPLPLAFMESVSERRDLFGNMGKRAFSMEDADLLDAELFEQVRGRLRHGRICNRQGSPPPMGNSETIAQWVNRVRSLMAEKPLTSRDAWEMCKGRDIQGFCQFAEALSGPY